MKKNSLRCVFASSGCGEQVLFRPRYQSPQPSRLLLGISEMPMKPLPWCRKKVVFPLLCAPRRKWDALELVLSVS